MKTTLVLVPEEERCGHGGASDRGPFSGDPSGGMEVRVFSTGRTRARLVHRADMLACEVVAGLHVATRAQVAAVLGGPSREVVSRLFRLGFLDRLETGRTPPAYCPGPALRRRRGMELGVFTAERFLRQVAASQVYLALPGGEWRSEPRPGFQARWDCAGRTLWVVCPREWPNEVSWFRAVVGSLREGEEVLAVAGTPAVAAECARVSAGRPRVLHLGQGGCSRRAAAGVGLGRRKDGAGRRAPRGRRGFSGAGGALAGLRAEAGLRQVTGAVPGFPG